MRLESPVLSAPLKSHPRRPKILGSGTSAFTLVELLVSMAILSLIVVLVAQLVNSTSATSKLQSQRLDADSQARVIFDRMAIDFAGMVRRPDMDCSAYEYPNYRTGGGGFKQAGNDGILFFSQALSMGVSADQPQDSVSVVGYRIYDSGSDSENAFQLDRAGQGANWSSASANGNNPGLPFLSFLNPLTITGGQIQPSSYEIDKTRAITEYWNSDFGSFNTAGSMPAHTATGPFHTLSRDTFRLEFALLMKDGTFLKQNSLDFTKDEQRAFRDVQAIVVTIAILDSASRERLGNDAPSVLRGVASKLVDSDSGDAAELWTKALQSGVPPVVASNARVYQRYFYLQ